MYGRIKGLCKSLIILIKILWTLFEKLDINFADTMSIVYKNWLKWDKTLNEEGIHKKSNEVDML
jgi:hypothetical protein